MQSQNKLQKQRKGVVQQKGTIIKGPLQQLQKAPKARKTKSFAPMKPDLKSAAIFGVRQMQLAAAHGPKQLVAATRALGSRL
jgi:hypothetical protein